MDAQTILQDDDHLIGERFSPLASGESACVRALLGDQFIPTALHHLLAREAQGCKYQRNSH